MHSSVLGVRLHFDFLVGVVLDDRQHAHHLSRWKWDTHPNVEVCQWPQVRHMCVDHRISSRELGGTMNENE